MSLIEYLLLTLAIVATYWDLRFRRIPNWLTVSALFAGLLVRVVAGWGSAGSGLAAAGIGLALGLPFFLVGGLGGGDVKLLTATGMIVGLDKLPETLFATAVAGGILAIGAVMLYGNWIRVFYNLKQIIAGFWQRLLPGREPTEPAVPSLDSPDAVTTPYGVAIASGSLVAWFMI